MNWYLATVVFQVICGDGDHAPQFDEQVRLVVAATSKEALEKAVSLGAQEAGVFYNNKQQLVQWKFVDVTEIFCLQHALDGAEVFSHLNEVTNAAAYTSLLQDKAAATRNLHLLHQP